MTRRSPRTVLVTAIALASAGYAGTSDTHFSGMAGPYAIQVVVHTPGVIPGLARIIVRPQNPSDVEKVAVQPVVWNIPPENAPAADPAELSNGDFRANLWLMVSGSYGVRVTVTGARGKGTAIVPVTAVAYQRREMPGPLSLLLLALAAFLAAGFITIVRAAAKESVIAPGHQPGRRDNRRGWIGLAGGSLVAGLALLGGYAWWGNVDQAYRAGLYRAPVLLTSVANGILSIEVQDSIWVARRRQRPLVRDEGHLAHVFLLGDRALAHLHPLDVEGGRVRLVLPALPRGAYRVFAEVVDSTGFSETLTASIEIDGAAGNGTPSGHWIVHEDRKMNGGIALKPGPYLAITVSNARGEPMPVDWQAEEPAEAVLLGSDGELIHLRPHGTMPRAAIERFAGRSPAPADLAVGEVRFPYSIPPGAAGKVWIHVRAGGRPVAAVLDQPGGGN